jgi:hypothetical protein
MKDNAGEPSDPSPGAFAAGLSRGERLGLGLRLH